MSSSAVYILDVKGKVSISFFKSERINFFFQVFVILYMSAFLILNDRMAPPNIFDDFLFHVNFVLMLIHNPEVHGSANCVMQLQPLMWECCTALSI
jgi:hypothetical protein